MLDVAQELSFSWRFEMRSIAVVLAFERLERMNYNDPQYQIPQ